MKPTKEVWDFALSLARVEDFMRACEGLDAAREEMKKCHAALTKDDVRLLRALAQKQEELEAAEKCTI